MKKIIMVVLMVVMVSMVGCSNNVHGVNVYNDGDYIYCYDEVTNEYIGYVYIGEQEVIVEGTTKGYHELLSNLVMDYCEDEGIEMNWTTVE